jgi:Zn-finger nucleic acid-binding protein
VQRAALPSADRQQLLDPGEHRVDLGGGQEPVEPAEPERVEVVRESPVQRRHAQFVQHFAHSPRCNPARRPAHPGFVRTLVRVICPKCQELMRTIDKNGVHIDQCERCRGVFLDGGELEQIIAAERDHYAQPMPSPDPTAAPPPMPGGPPPAYQPPSSIPGGGAPPAYQPPPGTPPPMSTPPPPVYGGYAQPGYPQPGYGQPHYGQRRKRSFLEELFD